LELGQDREQQDREELRAKREAEVTSRNNATDRILEYIRPKLIALIENSQGSSRGRATDGASMEGHVVKMQVFEERVEELTLLVEENHYTTRAMDGEVMSKMECGERSNSSRKRSNSCGDRALASEA
jgi:hypothetical protein